MIKIPLPKKIRRKVLLSDPAVIDLLRAAFFAGSLGGKFEDFLKEIR